MEVKNRFTGKIMGEFNIEPGANLRGANLHEANLCRTDLRGANLRGTCLDRDLLKYQRQFVKDCFIVNRYGGRIVYRTVRSQHIGSTEYIPGHTYVAPNLSFDAATACHPGIYAGSLEQIKKNVSR